MSTGLTGLVNHRYIPRDRVFYSTSYYILYQSEIGITDYVILLSNQFDDNYETDVGDIWFPI